MCLYTYVVNVASKYFKSGSSVVSLFPSSIASLRCLLAGHSPSRHSLLDAGYVQDDVGFMWARETVLEKYCMRGHSDRIFYYLALF